MRKVLVLTGLAVIILLALERREADESQEASLQPRSAPTPTESEFTPETGGLNRTETKTTGEAIQGNNEPSEQEGRAVVRAVWRLRILPRPALPAPGIFVRDCSIKVISNRGEEVPVEMDKGSPDSYSVHGDPDEAYRVQVWHPMLLEFDEVVEVQKGSAVVRLRGNADLFLRVAPPGGSCSFEGRARGSGQLGQWRGLKVDKETEGELDTFRVTGLAPGSYSIRGTRENCAPWIGDVVVLKDGENSCNVVFAEEAEIRGTVLDYLGNPIRTGMIQVSCYAVDGDPTGNPVYLRDRTLVSGRIPGQSLRRLVASKKSDNAGRFCIRGLGPGKYVLRGLNVAGKETKGGPLALHSSGTGDLIDLGGGETLEGYRLVLQEPGGLHLSLTYSDGMSGAERTITLAGASFHEAMDDGPRYVNQTNESGRLTFGAIDPGHYTVFAESPSGAAQERIGSADICAGKAGVFEHTFQYASPGYLRLALQSNMDDQGRSLKLFFLGKNAGGSWTEVAESSAGKTSRHCLPPGSIEVFAVDGHERWGSNLGAVEIRSGAETVHTARLDFRESTMRLSIGYSGILRIALFSVLPENLPICQSVFDVNDSRSIQAALPCGKYIVVPLFAGSRSPSAEEIRQLPSVVEWSEHGPIPETVVLDN